jgi:hypothetical protein
MAPTAAATASVPTLTQSGARAALQAAEQHAHEMGVPMYEGTRSFRSMQGIDYIPGA